MRNETPLYQGFPWECDVTVTDLCDKPQDVYRVTVSQSHSLLDQYKSSVQSIRREYLRVPTKSGRPSRGPRFIAIGRCTSERGDQYGIVASNHTKGQRWACKTCLGFMEPMWADGPLPDIEDIRDEYHTWMAKGGRDVRQEFVS